MLYNEKQIAVAGGEPWGYLLCICRISQFLSYIENLFAEIQQFFSFFLFWLSLWHVEVLWPGIKPMTHQWQCQILNHLSHQGMPRNLHSKEEPLVISRSWLSFGDINTVPVGNSMPGSAISLAWDFLLPPPLDPAVGPGLDAIPGRRNVSILHPVCRDGKAPEPGEEFRIRQQVQGNFWWAFRVGKAHTTYTVWSAASSASKVPMEEKKNPPTSYQVDRVLELCSFNKTK